MSIGKDETLVSCANARGVYDDILRGSRSIKTLLSVLCLKRSCLSLAAY